MSTATRSQNLARILMVFGFVLVLASVGASLQKWAVVQDIWDRGETFQDPLDPSTSTDDAVLADLQNVETLSGWENSLRLLGLASLLTAILITFRMGICSAAGTVKVGLPKFWQAFFAARDGEATELREAIETYKRDEEAA